MSSCLDNGYCMLSPAGFNDIPTATYYINATGYSKNSISDVCNYLLATL